MTDPNAAVMWAVIAGIFLTNAVYAGLLGTRYRSQILAALSMMFLCLAIGTALIGLLRTDWHDIIPLATLKVIERSTFLVAAVNGMAVIEMATGRWYRRESVKRMLSWWNHLLGSMV